MAPSGSATHFSMEVVSLNATDVIKQHMVEAINNIFATNAHEETHWKTFAVETDILISNSVVGFRGSQLESHVRECLLSPVLSTITKRMSLLPKTSCDAFKVYLEPEARIQLHEGSGRKASVDYVINLEAEKSFLRCIPIEAKKTMDLVYICQLSSYLNKLATCSDLREKMLVGLIISEFHFKYAFSPLKWEDQKAMPIIYVSPNIEWRTSQYTVPSALLLMSTVHLIAAPRMPCPVLADMDKDVLVKVTDKLHEKPYEARTSVYVAENTAYAHLALLQKQTELLEEKDRQLEQKDRELEQKDRELEQKDRELEQKLEHQQEQIDQILTLVSPKKRRLEDV